MTRARRPEEEKKTRQRSAAGARRGIQSADKTIAVLRALVKAGGSAPLRDLARVAGLPASLAHRYLSSLVAGGLAIQDPQNGHYGIGPLAIRMGAAALARVDALTIAAAALPALAADTGLTALLCVLGERGPVVVRWERSPIPLFTTLAVGSTLPLTGSATGRSILAFLPRRISEVRVKADMAGAGRRALAAMFGRLAIVARRGYDTADSEVVPGLSAVSAPVLNAQDEAVAAITLFGGGRDVARGSAAAIRALLQTVERTSHACGGTFRPIEGAPSAPSTRSSD